MARSRLIIKRFDPWSVLKFGAVLNLALLAIFLLVAGVIWFIIDRLQLVEQACSIATDVGFTACGINAGNLFRALVLLGLLAAVVQTAVLVFLAFLHNLIADLTGGLVIGVIDEGAPGRQVTGRQVTTASSRPVSGSSRPVTSSGATSQPVAGPATGQQARAASPKGAAAGESDEGSLFGSR